MKLTEVKYLSDLPIYFRMSKKKFNFLLYCVHIESNYDERSIPKKNGDKRIIDVPNKYLHYMQSIIAKDLNELINKKDIYAHGFIKGKSIFSNARKHVHKKVIINIDLENFFGSFNFGRILGFLKKNKFLLFDDKTAVVLTRLMCYKNSLPQGAPSSPIMSNLICNKLDFDIHNLSKRFHLTFTRYADDMTFSTNWSKFDNDMYKIFLEELKQIIHDAGFKLNDKKTRISFSHSRQEVTGLITNSKVNVNRNFYKVTRAMVNKYYFMKNDENKIKMGKIIQGRLSFIVDIYKKSNQYKSQSKSPNNSGESREELLKRFNFYNRFLNNSKPVIFTEGKTDKFYLIATLKKFYKEFPKLISVAEDGFFKLNVEFKSASKYILNSGGFGELNSIIQKLNRSYFDKYLKDKNNNFVFSEFPIIFLYDRENNIKSNALSILENKKTNLFKKGEVKNLFDDSIGNYVEVDSQKLSYAMTLPLVDGLDDTQIIKSEDKKGKVTYKYNYEIEDLFSKEFLSSSFNGKKFNRNGDIGEDEINKNGFSLYIYNNWQNIPDKEFDNFKKLLENISKLIK